MNQATLKKLKKTLEDKTVLCLAPSSAITSDDLKALKALPLPLKIPNDLQGTAIPYHANSDQNRFTLLKKALYDPSSPIIWALRGGYGSARLIDALLKLPKPKQKGIFIGFSDVTALHLFFSQHWGWKTIHGSGLTGLLKPHHPDNYQKICDILLGVKQLSIPLRPLNPLARKGLPIEGMLTGGNLSLLQTSIGTPWEIKTRQKIVFIEDTNEKGYRIDRMLTHLTQANLFKSAKAVILGSFGKEPNSTIALERFAKDIHIPVFETQQFGHEHHNHPLVYRSKVNIKRSRSTCRLDMHC